MNLRRYQNELIVGISCVVMLLSYLYKEGQINKQEEEAKALQSAITEIKEVIALKEIWANGNLPRKLKSLQNTVPDSKMKWNQKSKKVIANYQGLTANELNELVKKILNLGVEINIFDVKKDKTLYNVEFVCKW
jgi:hypothetical protein